MKKQAVKTGFSLIEVILATAVFSLLLTALVGIASYGEESAVTSGDRARAAYLADEGMEVIKNLKEESFLNLPDGTYGLLLSDGRWYLSGTEDVTGIFTRSVSISTFAPGRIEITVRVSWPETPERSGEVSLVSQLANWQ